MPRSSIATEDFSGTLGNWTQWYPAWGNCSITGGQLQFPGGDYTGIYWSGAGSFTDSQYAEADVSGAVWLNQWVGVGCRMQGQDATRDGYFFLLNDNDATNKGLELIKVVNGGRTTLASTTNATGSAFTMSMEVETSGSDAVIRCYVGATQIAALDYTDSSSPITGGTPGLSGQGGTLRADNWEGGNLTAAGPQNVIAWIVA